MLKINKNFKAVGNIYEYLNAERLIRLRFDNGGKPSLDIEIMHVKKIEKIPNYKYKYLLQAGTEIGTNTNAVNVNVIYIDGILYGEYKVGMPTRDICNIFTTINHSDDLYNLFSNHRIGYFKYFTYKDIAKMFNISLDHLLTDGYTNDLRYEIHTSGRTFTRMADFIKNNEINN